MDYVKQDRKAREISLDRRSSGDSLHKGAIEKPQSLDLIRKLCKALDDEEVAYCHWKSTATLDRSGTGEKDLDLLVSRADGSRFAGILSRLGFREARLPTQQQVPAVLDYYGYDREADGLVHVHTHYQLVMGHGMTKNYRLPIEEPFLKSATRDGLFNVPAPEFEFIVFVIRMVLKHSTWDAVLGLQGSLSVSEREELEYLTKRADRVHVYEILLQYLPFVNTGLFDDCVRSLQLDCPVLVRIKAGQQLERKIGAYARHSQTADVFMKIWRRGIWAIRRHVFGYLPKKRLSNGGLMIALVGGDGAGKSTAVSELYELLSKDFEAIKVHMGKPSWSWMTMLVRGILKVGRSLGLYAYTKSPIQNRTHPNHNEFPGYPWLLREVCTARDRYLTYVQARRFSSNGGIVISDRFPLSQIKSMDGLRSDLVTDVRQTNRLVEFLVRTGEKYYQQIMLPELLIVLRAHPDVAVQRKRDEDAASARTRSTEIWQFDWLRTSAHVVDANKSQPEVISEIKTLIWSHL